MRILLVAATKDEISPLISEFGFSISDFDGSAENPVAVSATQIVNLKPEILNLSQNTAILITGVGMVATAFALGKHLATNTYDLIINLGIAGSFDRDIALEDVLEITEDTFSELGAEDGDDFLSIEKLGFGTGIFKSTAKISGALGLKTARAITVNTVHGDEASIKKIADRLSPQLESMEGAAFFYACQQFNIPCLQIRAVSNYVEKRNRDNWKIGLAIKNLNSFAVDFLNSMV